MTRRVTDILGKPVITADGGEKLGKVVDVLLDEGSGEFLGVVVAHGVLKREDVLPAAAVQTFGGAAVVSRTAELIGAKEWRHAQTRRVRTDESSDE